MRILREHVAELVSGSIALLLGLILIVVRGASEPDGYIAIAVGAQVTVSLFMLKREMFSRLDERLEIYDLLGRISHLELYERGLDAIKKCSETLRELSQGLIHDRATAIFELLCSRIENAELEVLAVHLGRTVDEVEAWDQPHMRNYWQKNVVAAKKNGISVQRIFVLWQERVMDHSMEHLDPKVVSIMRQQQSDGIKVFVVWEHDVPSARYLEDLVIIDRAFVEFGSPPGGFVEKGWHEKEAYCSIDPHVILGYCQQFSELKGYTYPLDDWLAMNGGQQLTGVP